MKKITLLAGAILFSFSAYSQVKEKEIVSKNAKGKAEFINFSETKINSDEKSVSDFLVMQFDSKKSGTAKSSGKSEFRVKPKNNRIENNLESKKYQQFYNGIKVEFGVQNVVAENGKLKTVNGRYVDVSNVATTAKLSEKEALSFALKNIGADSYMWENQTNESQKKTYYPKAELIIVEKDLLVENPTAVLAYKFDIYASKPLSRDYVYVDATTGEVVLIDPIIKHIQGIGSTRYSGQRTIETQLSGSQYRLRDYSRGSGIETYNLNNGTEIQFATDFFDNDNNWTAAEFNNSNKDNAALDAHWGAEKTYDYFLTKHNRNSYDGIGGVIRSYVHFYYSYENAFWDKADKVMKYGDGGSFFSPLTSLDVVGHEIGHGVCSESAELVYQQDPGAIDESLSDIWGAMIEFNTDPSKQTYLIGEEIKLSGGALRSMSNPKSQGQPDTYEGLNWVNPNCGTPTLANDYCGVHTNSGVMNHWFYILAEGKSGTNDKGYSYNVTGIGKDYASKIVYRAETVYFNATTNYFQARELTIQAANDIFGSNSPQAIATCQAWSAVGLGNTSCGNVSSRIAGNDVICATSNYQYNLDNIQNFPVTWSVSSNLDIISSSNTSITVKASNVSINGTAAITANVNGIITTREIWVGAPSSYTTAERVEFCTFNYTAKDYPGTNQGTIFSWQFVSATGNASANTFYSYGNFAWFTACPPFSITMKLTSTNACGTTEQYVEQHLNNDDEEINITAPVVNKYFIYPNPAKDLVNIDLIDQNNQPANDAIISGELFDLNGQSRSKVQLNDNKGTLSVKDLNKGVYILRININNQFESHQIIVE